jgi:hypothetical protein
MSVSVTSAVKIIAVAGTITFSAFLFPLSARADANSYQAYLVDHHVNTAINSPATNLQAGFFACNALHSGQTPDQVASSQPIALVDVRGMIDAAQHELCPDTLR